MWASRLKYKVLNMDIPEPLFPFYVDQKNVCLPGKDSCVLISISYHSPETVDPFIIYTW